MTTLRLILTRHAKSSWGDPTIADHARPLNERGRRSAALMAEWLVSRGDLPGEVLCSDALRTRETWEIMAPNLGGDTVPLSLKPALYHAPADVMLAVLRGATAPVVMMIGHNPGMAEFAGRLLARAPADPDFARYPTGATLVATFEAASWSQITPGTGAALDFMIPRRLMS